jgi:hypothetical protein
MVSQIKVNEIIKQSGSSISIGESGDTINIGTTGDTINLAGSAYASNPDMAGTSFRAYNDAQQTVSHITWTKANMTNEVFDPGSNYDATNSKYVVPSTGYYNIFYHPFLQGSSANNFMTKVYVNGSGTESSMGSESSFTRFETAGYQSYFSMQSSYVAYLTKDDYLELYIYIEDNSGTISQGSGRGTSYWGGYKLA